jgi:hypothetical protein
MSSLQDDKVDLLLTRLDELVRWRPGAKGQYQDLHSAVARLKGSANHIILGRRGSGKTRLLDELKRAVAGEKTIVVTIGAEDFKELTYPDILIQILRSFLREFQTILAYRPRLLSSPWWRKLLGTVSHPILNAERRKATSAIRTDVKKLLTELDSMLTESEELDAEYLRASGSSSRQAAAGELAGKIPGLEATATATDERGETESSERKLKQREVKRIKVERLLGDFKSLLTSVCKHLDSRIILAVDDFYFIRRSDQPQVVDYVHRICKDTNAYLKIATIKHRSELFAHATVSRGVVPGHEIQPIALELPLGQYDSITSFLRSIWRAICSEVGIADGETLFMGGGFEQAVLASGGVPRDFLGIAKASILIARERNERAVGKRRINEASRQYTEETKLPELQVDVGEDEELVYLLLYDIVRFARDERRKNCFHIDIDRLTQLPDVHNLLDALVDSRLLHLITDNTSNARRAGRFAAYLLDVGLYGHPERRGEKAIEEVQFWVRDASGRLKNLDRSPVYPLRTFAELRNKAAVISSQKVAIRESILPAEEQQEPTATQLDLLFPASAGNDASETARPLE